MTGTALNSKKKKKGGNIDAGGIITTGLLFIGSVIMIMPFLWLISAAFKDPSELNIWPPSFLPGHFDFDNFTAVWKAAPFGRYFLNSLLIASASTVGIILTSSLGGYIFAKFHYKWLDFFFILILGTAIIPFEIYMIPLYIQMNSLKLVNTYAGTILPNIIMSFGLFFMKQTIVQQIPDEMIEAARVEGAPEWAIFFKVILPLLKSTTAALAIFAFLQGWNNFVWPLLIVNSKELFNMELGLSMFQSAFTVDTSLVSAGSLLSILPIFIVFIFFKKQIMQSIASTGMK